MRRVPKVLYQSPLSRCMSLNMAHTAQFLFQNGDGIGTSTGVTKDNLSLTSLVVKPIPY
jgi:hypothetical protein